MSIDLNKPNEFTLANVRQLIASGDVSQAVQLRVSSLGHVDLIKVGEEGDPDHIAFQLEPWLPEEKRVGREAAGDDQWVLTVYQVLKRNWPHPTSKQIDIHDYLIPDSRTSREMK